MSRRAAPRRLAAAAALAVVALVAPGAHATRYPPGPGYCCPDTLSIRHVQDPARYPHPVDPDTIYGAGGIVTGFDPKASGYGFYLQMANGLPYSGVFVFSGSFPKGPGTPLGLGDSVVVYGKAKEFQGGTEIEGYDGVQGSDDLGFRHVSSGNALPAFHIGSFTELREPASNPYAEAWEGCLVRLRGPLRVARISTTGGLGTSNSFLVVDAAAPSPADSVFVDGNSLTTYAPPAVGTVVDSVQGIFDQRSRGYRIQIRDAADLAVAAPPNLTDAFAVYDNDGSGAGRVDSVLVVFDRAVTQASAGNTANYTLGSFGTVAAATRLAAPSDNRVVLTLQNGLADGDPETLAVSGIVSLYGGLTMPTAQWRAFANGVLTPAALQAPDPAWLAADPCEDRSGFAGPGSSFGTRISVAGIVTGQIGATSFLQDGNDPRAAVAVFAPIAVPTTGHRQLFAGALQEFFGSSEVASNVYVRDYGAAAIPTASVRSVGVLRDGSCDSSQSVLTGEDFEHMLVRVEYVRVTANGAAGTSFVVAATGGAADSILIGAAYGNFSYAPDSGQILHVTGELYPYLGSFVIYPRSDADIQILGEGAVAGPAASISNSGADARDPALLRGAGNRLFATWGQTALQASFSLSLDGGANWARGEEVPRQGSQPAVALADSGKILLLASGLDSLRLHQSVDGGIQLLPIETLVDGARTYYPALATGASGHVHAAWERHQAGVFASRTLDGGATFSVPIPLAGDSWPADRHSMVRLAASAGDTVYAFWEYERFSGPANRRILLRRSINGGASFGSTQLLSDTTRLAVLGDAHVDAGGSVYLLRRQSGPTDTVAFLRSTDGGASFTTVGRLPVPASSGVCPQSFVLGPGGHVHAVMSVCGIALYYTHSADGGASWDALVDVTQGATTVSEPRGATVLLDAGGAPVVMWSGAAAGSTEVFFARMTP